ncbi:MAG: CDP-glycerol glycerophosphotransferase family protein [Alphaproteobacteria bacterium]|nr:CDP-glycerol glycerophosphotransferase family protein [Alphaproteobacteria bacterium]
MKKFCFRYFNFIIALLILCIFCIENSFAKSNSLISSKYDIFFEDILKKEKQHLKDSYILFDCLYDKNAESIDAYSLFLYMKQNNLPVYYVLLKDNPLYQKLKNDNELDNVIVIENYSKRDGENFLKAIKDVLPRTKAIISSFGTESIIDKYFHSLKYLKYIFIQHGQVFFKQSVMYSGYLFPKKFPYILASSDIERAIFRKYGWEDKNILKAGLPRWDLLKDKEHLDEKSILIMFTWRLTTPRLFAKSLFLKRFSSLLNNKEFNDFLLKNNIKIYLAHHHAFKTNSNININIDLPNIEIVDMNNISHYIKKSSLLITDLSSVSFDFMFQNKPVIFYGLDRGDILLEKNQYNDLEILKQIEKTFPNIVFEEKELIELVKQYVNNGFMLEEKDIQIYDKFFFTKKNIRQQLLDEINRICQ